MSSIDAEYTINITLLDRLATNRTVVAVDGDATTGNLTKHRVTGRYLFTGLRKHRAGILKLRTIDGLFIDKAGEPTLIDPTDFTAYLIEVQCFQHSKEGEAGHPDPLGRAGELVRYEFSTPVQSEDKDGRYLSLQLSSLEGLSLKNHFDSRTLELHTPQDAIVKRYALYGANKGLTDPVIFFSDPTNFVFPDDDFLKQDWIINGQRSTWDLGFDTVKRLSTPRVIGGNFTDHYIYYVNSATITNTLEVFGEEFGSRSSGAVITPIRPIANPEKSFSKKHELIVQNADYRDIVIVRGQSGVHTLPMEHTRFASDIAHAKISGVYSAVITYETGDYAKSNNQLFKSKVDNNLGNTPSSSPVQWENLSTATRHTPLTTDIDIWKAMLSGKDPLGDGFYEGFFTDMNVVMPNYDHPDTLNEFEAVSLKDVWHIAIENSSEIPSNQIYNGMRVLVASTVSGGDEFAGHANQIAQYFSSEDVSEWKFSENPVEDDTIMDRKNGKVLRFVSGAWIVHWALTAANFADSVPFHPVKSITKVAGPDGVANSAIQFEFDFDNIAKAENLAGRYVGFDIIFPIVPKDEGSRTVGDVIKTPVLDFENLTTNPTTGELADYNDGKNTEDLSTLRGIVLKIEPNFQDSSGDPVNGMSEIPFIWAFRDIFDRTVYTEAKARINGKWGTMKLEAGPNAKMQLHDSRTDELFSIFGYVFPHNFFLTEKEYTGVNFDWRRVKEIKCFWKGAFDQNFFYTGSQNSFWDNLTAHLKQIAANTVKFYTNVDAGTYVIDKATLKISQLRFMKDALVTTASSKKARSKTKFVNTNNFGDYYTMEGIAAGELARSQHFPRFTPIECYYDARIRFGETFDMEGPNVVGSPRTLTCAEYTIFDNEDGAVMMNINGYDKFEGAL